MNRSARSSFGSLYRRLLSDVSTLLSIVYSLWTSFVFSSLIVRYGRRTILNNPKAAGGKDLLLLRALS
jgi:hypothetical protein